MGPVLHPQTALEIGVQAGPITLQTRPHWLGLVADLPLFRALKSTVFGSNRVVLVGEEIKSACPLDGLGPLAAAVRGRTGLEIAGISRESLAG
jgi:hypothetical protein